MTVKELIFELQKRDPHAEVRVTWEGVIQAIDAENIYCSADGVVLIDGDGNSYKEQFEKENIKDGWPQE